MVVMISGCIVSRLSHVQGLTLMTGLNAPLFIQGRTQGDAIQGSITILVFHVLSLRKVYAQRMIPVSMLMVYLSHGFILPNIEPVSARMRPGAQGKFASLLTSLKSCAPCTRPLVQLSLPQRLLQ